ncbi:unnamed protein product, partial [Rotaria sp. Silwood1]
MNLQFKISNDNNNCRTHISENRSPPQTIPSYIHLPTTFSGYTNITGFANNIEHQKQTYNYNNQKKNNKLPLNINHISSLMPLNSFQQPSRRNCRTIKHAEQFKNKHPPIADPIIKCYRNDNNMIKNKNKFNGLILSDSMC